MGLEIIGAGFGRTGTDSLKKALDILGFGPCHHMYEIRANLDLLPDWVKVSQGSRPDWDAMFDGFRSQVDWPGAAYWEELAAHFPAAKVILTTRDFDKWYASMQATIIPFVAARGQFEEPYQNDIGNMVQRAVVDRLFDGTWDDKDNAKKCFEAHVAHVQARMSPDRLLVFDVSNGWRDLCKFLHVVEPDVAFPKGNSVADFQEKRQPKSLD